MVLQAHQFISAILHNPYHCKASQALTQIVTRMLHYAKSATDQELRLRNPKEMKGLYYTFV